MQVCRLKANHELEFFIERYNYLTKMTVSWDYLRAAEVYGLYSEDKLVGGFALAFGDAMVWPKIADKSLFTRVDFSLRNSVELNMVWADPEFKKTGRDTIRLWWSICRVVSKTQANSVTFACEDTPAKKNLMSRYEIISSGLLYNGPITKYEGRRMKVWWSTPLKFRLVKLLYIAEYFRIALRQYRRGRGVHQESNPANINQAAHV